MTKKRYTREEDAIIINTVKANPSNLENAFEIAARSLPNRTKAGVGNRYYSVLRKQEPLLITGNDTNYVVNTKITPSVYDPTHFNPDMRDNVLINIFNTLPKEDLIQFFMESIGTDDKKKILRKVLRTLT